MPIQITLKFAGTAAKSLSRHLASVLIAVKTNLQRYHDTSYSKSKGVNQMWILKNWKD